MSQVVRTLFDADHPGMATVRVPGQGLVVISVEESTRNPGEIVVIVAEPMAEVGVELYLCREPENRLSTLAVAAAGWLRAHRPEHEATQAMDALLEFPAGGAYEDAIARAERAEERVAQLERQLEQRENR